METGGGGINVARTIETGMSYTQPISPQLALLHIDSRNFVYI